MGRPVHRVSFYTKPIRCWQSTRYHTLSSVSTLVASGYRSVLDGALVFCTNREFFMVIWVPAETGSESRRFAIPLFGDETAEGEAPAQWRPQGHMERNSPEDTYGT
jgi:hypothetical protein